FAFTMAAQIPQPKDVLGFTPGDDRKLANWAKVVEYFQKLDAASDRVMFQEIGKTTMGAPLTYATISSPENLRNLEKYKQINAKLADPRTFKSNDAEAKRLIAKGKTIVMITCGVHSNEVGSTLSSMLIAYKLASDNSADIKKILDNTIIILVPSLNPDGVDIINNWYQKTLGTKFEGTEPPELYHKYVGHDDNRDWYAFTQVETQLTVDKIHNVWHPQIVNDIHQQGELGSRLFLPPYMDPVEPNVPKQIVDGYTELGNYVAADLRKQGLQGITTNSTYDAWTPARAYSHYHGGVRILSETASCKLATPITVKYDELRNGLGYDVRTESPNFGPVWKGGEWHIRDITNYMTAAAFSILHNAADNREKWLTNFYAIGKEAVRLRKKGETVELEVSSSVKFEKILKTADVEFHESFKTPDTGDYVISIPMNQPYANFAKTLLEKHVYPDLKDGNGNPIPPYDVTAHTLSLLLGLEVEQSTKPLKKAGLRWGYPSKMGCEDRKATWVQIYRSEIPAIDEGWTRFVVEERGKYVSSYFCEDIHLSESSNKKIRNNAFEAPTIIFPDQPPNQILNGYAKGTMPDEYTGGVGREGVENLKKFVEAGGTLVFLNRSSDFAIEQFNLPIRDVTKGLARKDFYIPGSILRTELDTTNPIAKGMPKESIAWFESGPAFEVLSGVSSPTVREGNMALTDVRATDTIRVIARYPSDPKQILLSGWLLGAEKIAGKAALVEVKIGKGKIILFGFRPQYRGQSLATFPLLFNAISQ
ncbi:MAG: M14 family zinc carboxypeptidase, partial [Pyrinomonadaceae bacterium]